MCARVCISKSRPAVCIGFRHVAAVCVANRTPVAVAALWLDERVIGCECATGTVYVCSLRVNYKRLLAPVAAV